MQYYDTIELMPHTATYYDGYSGEIRHLSYAALQHRSVKEKMDPLSRVEIFSHPIGRALVGTTSSLRCFERRKVLAYAGVKGFEEFRGKYVATIGGLLVLPSARNNGFGESTVEAVVAVAETPEALAEYGHEALLAYCNDESRAIFANLEFEEVGFQDNKTIMLKTVA